MDQHESPEKKYDLERLVFFSDGVFAIVITLLVIELHPPAHWDRTFAGLMRAEWRSLLAYAVSFIAVGAYWNVHRVLFRRVVRFHPGLVFFNLLLLGVVVLVPFAAELIFETGPTGQPFAIFLGVIAALGLAQAALWAFAAFLARVVDARISMRDRGVMLLMLALAPVLLSAASFQAAVGGSNAVVWLLPFAAALGIGRRLLSRKAGLSD